MELIPPAGKGRCAGSDRRFFVADLNPPIACIALSNPRGDRAGVVFDDGDSMIRRILESFTENPLRSLTFRFVLPELGPVMAEL
ncbi:unnamed protein product [Soboliphyme baturini]|uniref:Transcriptional regulator n=1 Tax=Soboliphyme baturini TaxID=241478 RepID=A0A183J8P5_9BILA|nr:unnamed protein product [Soboliphyme baturini]